MSWSKDYKKSIDCDNPKGFSQRAHCAARRKRARGEETKSKSPFNEMHEVKSHKSVEQIAKKHRLDVSFVKNQLEMGIPIEHEHTKDKDLATDIALQHLDEIPDYYTRLKKMESDAKKEHKKFKDVKENIELVDEGKRDGKSAKDPGYSLRDWFKGGGWVQAGGKYDGKPCAKQPGQKTKPFCRDADDRASMSKKERNRRAAKKRKEDPNPNRSGAAKIVTKEEYIQEKKGEKDACYHKVKSRYKIWPSAYASGALVKCRKVGADNWGTKSEEVQMIRYCPKCNKDETRDECKYGEKYWDMYSMPSRLKKYTPNTPHPGNMPEGYDHEYSMARSELSTIIDAARRLKKKIGKGEGNLEAWVQSKITKAADYIDTAADYVDSGQGKVDEEAKKCWPGYEKKGTQKLFGKNYNRCVKVKKESYSNWREELSQLNEFQLPRTGTVAAPLTTNGITRQYFQNKFLGMNVGSPQPVPLDKEYGPKTVQNFNKLNPTRQLVRDPYLNTLQSVPKPGAVKTPTPTPTTKPQPKPTSQKPIQTIQQSNQEYADRLRRAMEEGGMKPKGNVSRFTGMPINQSYEPEGNLVEHSNWREEIGLSEDWQKVNRQDRTDGLSQKAVDAYRREHPGSKLQTAVTEKKPKGKRAKRRANFCRRMKGMKSKLTSAKTARDPDSRINKALRRWNCN